MTEWKKATKKPVTIEYREPTPNTELIGLKYEAIKTLEGTVCAFPGKDFVIKGVKGELYPIKKEIFAETYEIVVQEKTGE
jgi:hypothetical protein